VKMQQVQRT